MYNKPEPKHSPSNKKNLNDNLLSLTILKRSALIKAIFLISKSS